MSWIPNWLRGEKSLKSNLNTLNQIEKIFKESAFPEENYCDENDQLILDWIEYIIKKVLPIWFQNYDNWNKIINIPNKNKKMLELKEMLKYELDYSNPLLLLYNILKPLEENNNIVIDIIQHLQNKNKLLEKQLRRSQEEHKKCLEKYLLQDFKQLQKK